MYPLLLHKAYQNDTYDKYILLTKGYTVYLKLNQVDYNYSISQYGGYQSYKFKLIIDKLQCQKMREISLILNDQINDLNDMGLNISTYISTNYIYIKENYRGQCEKLMAQFQAKEPLAQGTGSFTFAIKVYFSRSHLYICNYLIDAQLSPLYKYSLTPVGTGNCLL